MENNWLNGNKKFIVASVLIIIILYFTWFLFNNLGEMFNRKVILNYPNGCNETYINEQLVGEPCETGETYWGASWNTQDIPPTNWSGNKLSIT